jgi:hypothetical protein
VIPSIHLPRARPNEERSAFARGPKERSLRIVVDRPTAPAGEVLDLLLTFAEHPLLDVLSSQGEGLSHLDIGPIDPAVDQAPVVISHRDGTTTYTGVWPASDHVALADDLLRAHPAIADHGETVRVLLLASAAEDYEVDALATGSAVLLDPAIRGSKAQRSNAMTITEAVALIGLYLRLRDDFKHGRHAQGYWERFDRGGFYWVLARELLPSAWRCGSAAHQHGQAIGDDTVFQLVLSAIKRLDNSLRARDRLHGQMQLMQSNGTADEGLFYLDAFLVFMVGAFDAVGRAAHLVYGLKQDNLHLVNWRRDWLTKHLKPVAPVLAQLMDKGTPARDVLDLLALLRNTTVHGEALRTVAVLRAGQPLRNVLLLPKGDESKLLAIVARRGGNDAWGIRRSPGIGILMQMDTFVEAVLPLAVKALDQLIMEVSVEADRLPGVDATKLPTGPPSDDGPFHSIKRRRVRILAGL